MYIGLRIFLPVWMDKPGQVFPGISADYGYTAGRKVNELQGIDFLSGESRIFWY